MSRLPECAVCKKPVERVGAVHRGPTTHDPIGVGTTVVVFCHGQKDVVFADIHKVLDHQPFQAEADELKKIADLQKAGRLE